MIQTYVCAAKKKKSLLKNNGQNNRSLHSRETQTGFHLCLIYAQKSLWHLRGTGHSAQLNRSPQISYIHFKAVNTRSQVTWGPAVSILPEEEPEVADLSIPRTHSRKAQSSQARTNLDTFLKI